jgi:DNA-binding GntR family transcriptional regulator
MQALNNPASSTATARIPVDTTQRSRIHHILRNAILDGHFNTGQKLIERELCDLTGASRSILREVLAKLEASGLIERQSYRGYRVTRLTVQNIYEIFELRETLETLAAELFTERASQQEVNALEHALTLLEDSLVNFDIEQVRAAKQHYYDVLFTGCRNKEIRRALENVIERIFYLRSSLMQDPERRNDSIVEIRRLTKALVERDRVAARAATLAHLYAARNAVLLKISSPDNGPDEQSTVK